MVSSEPYSCVTRQTVNADVRTLLRVVQHRQLPFLAAAIAYYAFLSVVPLFIIGFTVATALAGQTIAAELITALDEFLTPEAASVLEETLIQGAGRGGVTVFGLVVLLWSGLRIFRGLDIAFSQIYGATTPKPLTEQIRDALLAIAGIAVALVATVSVSAFVAWVGVPLAGLGGTLGLLFVLTAVFFPVYYLFPAPVIGVREALPGTIVAAIGWTFLGSAFSIYTSYAGAFELYGVLGGVLLLLIWFYFGGLILLFGGALNVVLGERAGDRQLQQAPLRDHTQRASMSESDGPNDEEPAENSPVEDGTVQQNGDRIDGDNESPDGPDADTDGPTGRRDPDVSARVTQETIDDLRRELDELEQRLEDRTVDRDEFEGELKRDVRSYVRRRTRRGRATGWGPYLVLLYGTAMTLGAFYLLSGGWAILAMFVIWLSTLGLYVLMIIVGVTVKGASVPVRAMNYLRDLR